MKNKNSLIIYQSKGGEIEVVGDFKHQNVWATQTQISRLFSTERSVVTKHINHIIRSGEVSEKRNVQKMHIANSDKLVNFYSLDIILSIGYRVNSARAIDFRKWANRVLKNYITKGYAVNYKQISRNYDAFMKSVSDIQELLPEHIILDPKAVLDLVKEFSSTWLSLNAYDKGSISATGATKRSVKLTGVELMDVILNLRDELSRKNEATDIFAQERIVGNIEGIVGNVMQSFAGKDVYRTIEEKAIHLLYFIVKDHPFVDGNKRSGAFAFIWFLRKAKAKKASNINPSALTALTLLIAESNPNKKDQMIALVSEMLK